MALATAALLLAPPTHVRGRAAAVTGVHASLLLSAARSLRRGRGRSSAPMTAATLALLAAPSLRSSAPSPPPPRTRGRAAAASLSIATPALLLLPTTLLSPNAPASRPGPTGRPTTDGVARRSPRRRIRAAGLSVSRRPGPSAPAASHTSASGAPVGRRVAASFARRRSSAAKAVAHAGVAST